MLGGRASLARRRLRSAAAAPRHPWQDRSRSEEARPEIKTGSASPVRGRFSADRSTTVEPLPILLQPYGFGAGPVGLRAGANVLRYDQGPDLRRGCSESLTTPGLDAPLPTPLPVRLSARPSG